MNEEEIQQEYFKLQLMSMQMQELEKQMTALEDQAGQLQKLKDSVGEVKSFKQGSKILAPISPGLYVESELKNPDQLLMNIGSEVFVPKEIKEAQDVIDSRLKRVEEDIHNLTVDFQSLSIEAQKSQEKLQKHV
ncbi:MAG: prefoldin subunit alpha [Candidatus Woesearchaeota archaeon]|nr:MAG: prefoldin subunit alpha [Candidatus Woesearchaeota archaeon]